MGLDQYVYLCSRDEDGFPNTDPETHKPIIEEELGYFRKFYELQEFFCEQIIEGDANLEWIELNDYVVNKLTKYARSAIKENYGNPDRWREVLNICKKVKKVNKEKKTIPFYWSWY